MGGQGFVEVGIAFGEQNALFFALPIFAREISGVGVDNAFEVEHERLREPSGGHITLRQPGGAYESDELVEPRRGVDAVTGEIGRASCRERVDVAVVTGTDTMKRV